MPSLILEGGTLRPIFSAGVMDALLDNNIMFPYCIGVSAGITNGISYLSKQKGRNLEVVEKYRNDHRYIGKRNFLKCKSLFGLDFVFDEIPNKLIPFDMDTFLSYKGRAFVGVTNAQTGESEYFNALELDSKCTILRATCAIPLIFPAIKINNTDYFDGGLADPIPIQKAISDGNDKHLIILTRPKEYRKALTKSTKLCCTIIKNKYPKLQDIMLNRHENYNKTVKLCENLEKEGKAIIIRPTLEQCVESFEKDVTKLRENYNNGYKMCIEKLDEIRSLFR